MTCKSCPKTEENFWSLGALIHYSKFSLATNLIPWVITSNPILRPIVGGIIGGYTQGDPECKYQKYISERHSVTSYISGGSCGLACCLFQSFLTNYLASSTGLFGATVITSIANTTVLYLSMCQIEKRFTTLAEHLGSTKHHENLWQDLIFGCEPAGILKSMQ